MTDDSSVASLHHQQVALLATANGTHIAVQVGRDVGGSRRQRKESGGQGGEELDGDLEEKGIWLKRSSLQRTNPFLPKSTYLSQPFLD